MSHIPPVSPHFFSLTQVYDACVCVSHMDRSMTSTKHSQRLLVSPKGIGYSHSYFLSGFFPYYPYVSSLHPQKCPTWIPTVLPKTHTHTSTVFYSPSFTRKEGRGTSRRSLHAPHPHPFLLTNKTIHPPLPLYKKILLGPLMTSSEWNEEILSSDWSRHVT